MKLLPWMVIVNFLSSLSFAYVFETTNAGVPVRWRDSNRNINFEIHTQNASAMLESDVISIFSQSANKWKELNIFNIGLTQAPGQGTSDFDHINKIYFSSNTPHSALDANVVALTGVMFYQTSGEIVEADIEFNDRYFNFTANPNDSSIKGQKYFLGDIASHEMGHAFGLGHSGALDSTMYYTALPGQFNLHKDDIAGLKTTYGQGTSGERGSISGIAKGKNGAIFGTHITAINHETGEIEAASISDKSGKFIVSGLSEGNYYLMIEPFPAPQSTLSPYFFPMRHDFCTGGTNYKRSFYAKCGENNFAQAIKVSANQNTEIGILAPKCSEINDVNNIQVTGSSAFFGKMNYTTIEKVNYFSDQSDTVATKTISESIYSRAKIVSDIDTTSISIKQIQTSVYANWATGLDNNSLFLNIVKYKQRPLLIESTQSQESCVEVNNIEFSPDVTSAGSAPSRSVASEEDKPHSACGALVNTGGIPPSWPNVVLNIIILIGPAFVFFLRKRFRYAFIKVNYE